MKPAVHSVAPKGSKQPSQFPRKKIPSNEVYGFPVSVNEYQMLQDSRSAKSTTSRQVQDRLTDPRNTRLASQRAAKRETGQGTLENLYNEGICQIVPPVTDAQGTFDSGECVEPVASRIRPKFFPYSLSVSAPDVLESQSGGTVQNLLGIGAASDDALYISNVNGVACTDSQCNKRISVAGPERSAGRPGHTPTRRLLACEKTIEDSCAGQDWLAGRLGIRPFGASFAACPSSRKACIGPYGTASRQLHHTGPNTREETYIASSTTGRPRHEESTTQHHASSSGRPAAEDRASPATVALHPRRPPYFSRGKDEDVYVWASIVSRWFDTVQGEPSRQMTYVVSLLRGATYEWYQHYETRTGCPGDWTPLRHAMLERFGSSIRAKKARAGLR